MADSATPEVINGTTQLERRLCGVHPRLYITRDSLEELLARRCERPWAALFERAVKVADGAVASPCPRQGDKASLDRGHGCYMPHLALAFLTTRETRYLDAAKQYIRASATYDTWGSSLLYGHVSHGMSVAFDWLHEHLDEETRRIARDALAARMREVTHHIGTHQGWVASVYACNHLPVITAGIAGAGAALYGEVDGAAPPLRLCMEKLRLMTEALGPDGVSQEGLGYGEYYCEFLLKGLVIARDLLNLDLVTRCEWIRNTPLFYLHSCLPRGSWARGNCVMHFGDGVRYHWYGPDVQLRLIASVYRDPLAQWLADETFAAGVCADSDAYMAPIWYDPTVPAERPAEAPTMMHFADKDIVFARSGWDGDESFCGFKCGPHFGWHALRNYMHDIGGGHMCPDAGAFQVFARGDWLIVDAGYSFKLTDQQNTVLVNGVGQTGEGGDWFETTELRMEKRAPAILHAESHEAWDYVIGNVAPAYGKEAGLGRFLRHLLFLKPACWVMVDELETEAPSTFELRFHAEHPFTSTAARTFTVSGPRASLRLTVLAPQDAATSAFKQQLKKTGGHEPGEVLEALAVSNAQKTRQAVFVTVLEAYQTGNDVPSPPLLEGSAGEWHLSVSAPGGILRLKLATGQNDPSAPVLLPEQ